MKQYMMAIDQGTTSSRCVLYNKKGAMVSMAQKEFRQIYPQAGWVEHDAMEIWQTQLLVCREALAKIGAFWDDIAAIGITNQRETTVVWDRNTGKPVYNAIVWQCRRTADLCNEIGTDEVKEMIREKTGLILDPYFSGTKIKWILDHVDGARERAEAGDLLFGTIETWLIWNLTGGRVHVTDHSNAARTMLFNIHTLQWDEELLSLLGIPASMLPEPVENSVFYGETDETMFGGPVPITGAAGDQQAALFGQLCFEEQEGKMTYGTGGFMLLNTGDTVVKSANGLLSTVGWTLNGRTTYAMEGSIFVEGAVIQWLRDELGILKSASESETLATSVADNDGVYLVPAFTGLGAPHWDPFARGTICGLTRGTKRAHIVRAALESMAYQTVDLSNAMKDDLGHPLKTFKVDGGACANDFLMQIQADLLATPVVRPAVVETTSLGAAYLAGLAAGYWEGLDEIKENEQIDRIFTPAMAADMRGEMLENWHEAVRRAGGWVRG
ncbi:MAG: glycerol kinase GlpK [Clostridiales bacterium]|nr:glycerol kinase GlpK [Clostridiales bacterium]